MIDLLHTMLRHITTDIVITWNDYYSLPIFMFWTDKNRTKFIQKLCSGLILFCYLLFRNKSVLLLAAIDNITTDNN